jgi:hypothetical protein
MFETSASAVSDSSETAPLLSSLAPGAFRARPFIRPDLLDKKKRFGWPFESGLRTPFPKEAFNPSGSSPEEETRLNALCADVDFQEVDTQREQIGIACKHLRAFQNGHRFTFEAIGRFFGGKNAGTIERQFLLSQQD